MARSERDGPGDTATRILDVAEQLLQTRGFNGFSYADVAAEINITTASLHYHFPGKAELGRALIARYAANFFGALADIEQRFPDAPGRLEAYAELYARVLHAQRLCLCGMLAAEYQTLPAQMREAVISFFDNNEAWLARVLEVGRQDGTLEFNGSAAATARMIICGLEGAMLVTRPYGDNGRFRAAASQLLASLRRGEPVPAD
jgi:TetR/AcrR family transcriptional repressor of nem operon